MNYFHCVDFNFSSTASFHITLFETRMCLLSWLVVSYHSLQWIFLCGSIQDSFQFILLGADISAGNSHIDSTSQIALFPEPALVILQPHHFLLPVVPSEVIVSEALARSETISD